MAEKVLSTLRLQSSADFQAVMNSSFEPLAQWRSQHQLSAVNEYALLSATTPASAISQSYRNTFDELNMLTPQMVFGTDPSIGHRAISIVANFCRLFPTETVDQRCYLWIRLKSLIKAKSNFWRLPPYFVHAADCGNPDQVRWFLFNLVYYEMTCVFRCVARFPQ